MDWQPIETAPRDGSRQWVRREYEGRVVKEGWAVWGVNCADAPMRQWAPGGLGAPIPPDPAYADRERWLTEDRMYSFPTPTHWTPNPPIFLHAPHLPSSPNQEGKDNEGRLGSKQG